MSDEFLGKSKRQRGKAIRKMHGHQWIPDEEINMLWKRRSFYTGAALAAIDDCLNAINIVACEECGGEGRLVEGSHAHGWAQCQCPLCEGHGWKVVSDE